MSRDVAARSEGEPAPVSVDALPTLELDDLAHEEEAALVARGRAYAREYGRIQGAQTTLLKNLAVVVVSLRIQYQDMRGAGHDYRQTVAEMYRSAGIDPDSSSAMQAAVRWHVGNLLRRTMTPRELEANDLQLTSPLERLQDNRAVNSALVKAAKVSAEVAESTPKPRRSTGEPAKAEESTAVKATADHLRLATVARDILGKLDRNVIKKHMTDGQRHALDVELAAMERKLASLRKLTQKPSSRG
ncbi:hypothetical protein ACFRCI_23435 [Streptomyces sp. NPDC056638]|uniref:hypothetical protein n=1 Tax=Streptomyces sp. NPDC056638 TaxID=3345887 RepID=UPI003696409F